MRDELLLESLEGALNLVDEFLLPDPLAAAKSVTSLNAILAPSTFVVKSGRSMWDHQCSSPGVFRWRPRRAV